MKRTIEADIVAIILQDAMTGLDQTKGIYIETISNPNGQAVFLRPGWSSHQMGVKGFGGEGGTTFVPWNNIQSIHY